MNTTTTEDFYTDMTRPHATQTKADTATNSYKYEILIVWNLQFNSWSAGANQPSDGATHVHLWLAHHCGGCEPCFIVDKSMYYRRSVSQDERVLQCWCYYTKTWRRSAARVRRSFVLPVCSLAGLLVPSVTRVAGCLRV